MSNASESSIEHQVQSVVDGKGARAMCSCGWVGVNYATVTSVSIDNVEQDGHIHRVHQAEVSAAERRRLEPKTDAAQELYRRIGSYCYLRQAPGPWQVRGQRCGESYTYGEGVDYSSALADALKNTEPKPDAEAKANDDGAYVAWMRYRRGNGVTRIVACDSDDEGAFKVYRHPEPRNPDWHAAAKDMAEALENTRQYPHNGRVVNATLARYRALGGK